MLKALKGILKKLLIKDYKYKSYHFTGKLEKLGTEYGGWIVPIDYINRDSVCYLAGAGEDISFDVALAKKFHCKVLIFDPTPRSKAHFEKVRDAASNGTTVPLNQSDKYYQLDKTCMSFIRFEEIGIWKQKDTLKFFAPKDDSHISHSISNLQQTDKYIEARVERLSEIMKENNHSFLDILKLDIEGAEFDVIDSIIGEKLMIRVLCIEFHKIDEPNAIQTAISKLEQYGFAVVARENLDFTFINKKLLITT